MKAAQISKPGGDWELVEREIPEPQSGQVRVKVLACGICHSDVLVKDGGWPGLQYPRVPAMRLQVASMQLVTTLLDGPLVNALELVGTAGTVSSVNSAGVVISPCASIGRSLGSTLMVATLST